MRREREQQGRLGTRKLYHMLQAQFKKAGVRVGRDRMFEELRKHDLLLEPVPAHIPYNHTVLPQSAGVWERD